MELVFSSADADLASLGKILLEGKSIPPKPS